MFPSLELVLREPWIVFLIVYWSMAPVLFWFIFNDLSRPERLALPPGHHKNGHSPKE